jgi:hypothetical protein
VDAPKLTGSLDARNVNRRFALVDTKQPRKRRKLWLSLGSAGCNPEPLEYTWVQRWEELGFGARNHRAVQHRCTLNLGGAGY